VDENPTTLGPDKNGGAYKIDIQKKTDNSTTIIGTFVASSDHCYRIYESIWRNMDRENNLINQRITWAILLTAGILTAQTFLIGRVFESLTRGSDLTSEARQIMAFSFFLCACLSSLAAFFCFRVDQGVKAAQTQINYLKSRYERLVCEKKNLFQDVMKLPRPFGNPNDHLSGNSAAKIFPIALMAIWILFGLSELVGTSFLWQSSLQTHASSSTSEQSGSK